jgi:hypothetical protein
MIGYGVRQQADRIDRQREQRGDDAGDRIGRGPERSALAGRGAAPLDLDRAGMTIARDAQRLWLDHSRNER